MDRLLAEIVSGKYAPGSVLPPDVLLAHELAVSRHQLSEVVRALRASGVVRYWRGRAMVNPVSQWAELDPHLLFARIATDNEIPDVLLEARSVIEVGACVLAAERRTDEDVRALTLYTDDMAVAVEAGDVDAFVSADLKFHQRIMDASENAVLAAALDPVRQILMLARRQTSEFAAVRRHALKHHRLILEAIQSSNPVAAAASMRGHMAQTKRDLHHYVFRVDRSPVRRAAEPRVEASAIG